MSEASEQKKRSPVERFLVWGLIAIMLIIVVIEYRASTNFNGAQAYLSTALESSPSPTIDEVKANISGATMGPKLQDELGTDEYEFAFFSLFRSDTYRLRVQLLEVPSGESEPAEGERRIAEVYAPAVVDSVRKEHQDFIVNTPLAPPDADDGTGGTGGMGGMGGGGEEEGGSVSKPSEAGGGDDARDGADQLDGENVPPSEATESKSESVEE